MVDVATLGISVTSNADAATTGLNRLAGAAGMAEGAADRLKTSTVSAASATSTLGDAIQQATSRLAALKASTDPVGMAIDRVNSELMENDALLRSGSLSADQYARNQAVLGQRLDDLTKKQQLYNASVLATGRVARLSTTDALNLSRQFADIGVTAAMGMNPLMIAIQQGPQIADIMKTSGMGIGGIARELGLMTGILKVVNKEQTASIATGTAQATTNAAVATTANAAASAEGRLAVATAAASGGAVAATATAGALVAANGAVTASAEAAAAAQAVAFAPIVGIIAGVALAVGALVGVWALATRSIGKSIGSNIDHLKLNERQLKTLKDEGVNTAVTMGDVFSGTMKTAGDAIWSAIGPTMKRVGSAVSDFFDDATSFMFNAVKNIVGGMVGAFYAIKATWKMLPAAIGDAAVSAANLAIAAIESLINKGIDGINKLIVGAKALSSIPGLGFAGGLSTMGGISIGRLDNPNAGAGAAALGVGVAAFVEGNNVGRGAVQNAADTTMSNIRGARDRRVTGAAGEAGPDRATGGRAAGLSDEARALQAATEAAENYIKSMTEETALIGKNSIERQRAAVITAASAAQEAGVVEALVTRIREVGAAWEAATIAEAQSQLAKSLKEIADQTAFDTAQQGRNAREREVANAQREISIMLAAAEADGIPTATAAIQEQTAAILANAAARGQLLLDADNANDFADAMGLVADRVNDATESMKGLFGTAGDALASIVAQYQEYGAVTAEINARIAEINADDTMSFAEQQRERGRATEELAQVQIQHYGDMISAAKGFFQEGTAGYKIMQGAEQAYRLYQFAMAVKSMFFETAQTTTKAANVGVRMGLDAAETTSSVAKSGIRAAADGVAAFAKTLASLPFPFNIAAGAVVLAALVGVGVAMKGGGGGKTATGSASRAETETPTTYTPFVSHDRGVTYAGGIANDNRRISPPDASAFTGGGSRKTVFDFSNANFSGSDPEAVKAAVQQGIAAAAPEILQEARVQTYEDLQVLNRQKLGG